MSLHQYLRLLRRSWLIIVALALIGAAGAAAFTRTMTPSFGAAATIIVTTANDGTISALQQGNDFSTQRALTYASLGTTDSVLLLAAQASGDNVEVLRSSITVTPRTNTAIIDIVAAAPSGDRAAARANAVANALIVQAAALDGQGVQSPLRIETVSEAMVPAVANSPRPMNNILIGGVVGLALGVACVVLANTLDTRVRSLADLSSAASSSTITSIPSARRPLTWGGPARVQRHRRLEAFRQLRTNLQFAADSGGVMAVMGATTATSSYSVASELARVMGEVGFQVVVINADMNSRGPRAKGKPDAGMAPGLADFLSRNADVVDVLVQSDFDGVAEIAVGRREAWAPHLLSTTRVQDLIDMLDHEYDFVLVACPPVVDHSESLAIAARSKKTLLVIEAGANNLQEVAYCLDALSRIGVASPYIALDGAQDLRLVGTAVSADVRPASDHADGRERLGPA